jgi:hypothetical protein
MTRNEIGWLASDPRIADQEETGDLTPSDRYALRRKAESLTSDPTLQHATYIRLVWGQFGEDAAMTEMLALQNEVRS